MARFKKNFLLVKPILIRRAEIDALWNRKRKWVNMKDEYVKQEFIKEQKKALKEIVKQ